MQQKNKLNLTLQIAEPRARALINRSDVRRWAQAALFAPADLTIRFVNADEGRTLNRDYRGRDYATNVLTFAYTEDADAPVTEADIILCTEVLEREAAEQGLEIADHAAHLIVHGVLHAQGYDHEDDTEAAEMEALEIEILAALGIANPYAER